MSGAETLLEELERRQDQVLVDLDLLDARIVAFWKAG